MKSTNDKFPFTLEMINPTWLNTIQTDYEVAGVNVERVSDQGLTSDVGILTMSLRSGEQRTLIGKCSSRDLETRSKFSDYYAREVFFYKEIANQSDVRTPHCYWATCDGDEHLLLLENMKPAVSGSTTSGETVEFTMNFVELISGLHASWWNKPILARIKKNLPEFGNRFAFGYETALRERPDLMPNHHGRSTLKLAQALAKDIQSRWNCQWQGSQTVIQWDSHASNVMQPVYYDGTWSLLDWQNCAIGNGVWDVARFCVLSLPVDIRRDSEKDIVAGYVTALNNRGVTASLDEIWASYCKFLPLVFAQQIRFLASYKKDDAIRSAWQKAIIPRVTAALHDSF